MIEGEFVLVGIFAIPTMKEFQIYLEKASYTMCSFVERNTDTLTFITTSNVSGRVRIEVQIRVADILCIETLAK